MIITISREFGSGGRDLGRRLSEQMQIPCYDKEIISLIARNKGFDESYVEMMSEKGIQSAYLGTFSSRSAGVDWYTRQSIDIIVEQQKIIKDLASKGDCIIIGRAADLILSDMKPFRIFVYADMASRMKRCREREEDREKLSDAQLQKNIRKIDKERASHRASFSDSKWGDKANYDLCINTTDLSIEKIIVPLADLIRAHYQ